MKFKSKMFIVIFVLVLCCSFQGCNNSKSEEKETNSTKENVATTESNNSADTKEEADSTAIITVNSESDNSGNEDEEVKDTISWKQIKTIDTADNKVRCRMAGFLNETLGITTAQFGVLHNTLDGGETWTRSINTSDCIAGLEIIDEKNAFITANYSQVRVTNDGGANWSALPNFGDMKNEHCRYLSFIDPLTGWIANKKEVGFTKDGGKSWESISVPKVQAISAIWLSSVDEGYILSRDSKLYITSDGGTSWTEKDLGIKGLLISVCPNAALHVIDENNFQIVAYVQNSTEKGIYFFNTKDGGNTWIQKDLILEGGPKFVNFSRDGKFLTLTQEYKEIMVYNSEITQ